MSEMKFQKLGELAIVELSNIDKKSKDGEQQVILCNFVDVYHNWAITEPLVPDLMVATANDNQIKRFSLHKGQVAITKDSEKRDDIGISTYIADEIDNCVLGYHCALITPNESILSGKYLNVLLHSPYALNYWEMNASGSGQRYTLTKEIIEALPIPIIPQNEQEKIGEFYSALDKQIQNNNAIIAELESLSKTIYDYWFLQFDFPDENGKPYRSSGGKMVWNDELKREIPEGWAGTTVGDISVCHDSERIPVPSKERETMPGAIPYYGATGIKGYVNRYIFDGDYVLLAEDGSVMDEKGFPIIQRIHGKTWVNNHAHVLEPKDGYSCRLLMMILSDIPVVMIKTGSIQMKINQDNLNNYKVVKIPESKRTAFNGIVSPIDEEIIRLNEESKKLQDLRNFLLPMLMNGQVTIEDLPEAA